MSDRLKGRNAVYVQNCNAEYSGGQVKYGGLG